MKVIVVGCGRLGAELAHRLYKRGHQVSVIDNAPASFNSLPADFQGHLCEGDALNQDVLERAGITNADALAAVTNLDALNMVVGRVAAKVYNVPNVVARNYGPNCRSLFEMFGLQVVSSTSWGAQRIEEVISHSEVRSVFSAGNGEVEVYELRIPDAFHGRALSSLMTDEMIAVAVTRAGRAMMPFPDMVLQADDVLNVSATFEGIEAVRSLLANTGGEA